MRTASINFHGNWETNGVNIIKLGKLVIISGAIRYGTTTDVGVIADSNFFPKSATLGTIVGYGGGFTTYFLVSATGALTIGLAPTVSTQSYVVNVCYMTN